MKRKILAIALTLLMVLALLPVASFAEGENESNNFPEGMNGYITFSSEDVFTLYSNGGKAWDGKLWYSQSLSSEWKEWDGTTINSSSVSGGEAVLYVGGNGENTYITGINVGNRCWTLVSEKNKGVYCTGNIETLRGAAGDAPSSTKMGEYCYRAMFKENTCLMSAPKLPATTLANHCYDSMFSGCTGLTTAPALPATTLTEYCYYFMFNGCTGLATAPALPATTLAAKCYYYMFNDCTGLTTAPALSAATLADGCYDSMFYGCTGLTTAPALPATTLAAGCYAFMFCNCTGLTTAPALPATTLADECYEYMFSNCTGLTTAPALPATTLADECYEHMFDECIKLVAAPELPATTLAKKCYCNMFKKCESLTTAPELPAKTLTSKCYIEMFKKCTGLEAPADISHVTVLADDDEDDDYDGCCQEMYVGCSNLKVNSTAKEGYVKPWKATSATPTADQANWANDMFAETAGDITGTVTAGTTYYIKGKSEYTVDFNVQGHGTAPAAQTVEEGSKVTKPEDPVADGYTFGGWYKENTCETAWNFDSDTVTADTTLYAKWTETPTAECTVNFNTNGKCTAPQAQTVEKGGKAEKPESPVAEGFVFAGWYKESTCTNAWDFDNDTVTEDITLYAKWVQTTKDVAEVITSDKVKTTVAMENAEATAKKVLEQFAPDYGPDDKLSLIVKVSDEVSKEDAEKIKKASGDSEASMLDLSLWLKVNDADPVDISKKNNELITLIYDFDYTKKIDVKTFRVHDGGDVEQLPVYPETINDGECVRYDEDNSKVYITAWKYSTYDITFGLLSDPETTAAKTEYPVTFDSMGGTAVAGQHHAKGEKLEKPADPVKSGYTFAGWYLDKNYTQPWNFNLYTVSGPTTLYAKWTAGGAGTGGTTPNTGDSNTAWPYAVLGMLAAAAIAGICFKKRKTD